MNYKRLTQTLIGKVRDLEEEVSRLEVRLYYDDDDDDENVVALEKTLSLVREEINRGDTEYAVELIGRQIGY
ncbi:MAG: hypothetical protein KK482_20150 [Sinorhizobium meliloti]|uniref:hypothetical protein n=1 Tax=Sinorhizobium medicae TaxID=110321 RepID=UPI000FE025D8|nr:hypothetical protein [Sinorhizobium medicae]MCG5486003.1 hypothetical protein [Sinorhizobium meliloti]RVJ00934.1 hypothetical protein CN183_26065 [Sinorhizobium medicae]